MRVLYNKSYVKRKMCLQTSAKFTESELPAPQQFYRDLWRPVPVFTLNIRTPLHHLNMFVLNVGQVHFTVYSDVQISWVIDRQCRPWSDATFCGVWSESKRFVQAVSVQLLRVNTVWHSTESALSDQGIRPHYENMPIQNILKILQPKKEKIQIKKFWYFSYFCSKHRLWVLVRTASAR